MIKSNVGDDEFTDERKHVEKTLVGVLNEGVKKFIHHAKQFRKIQKLNKQQDHLIFAVYSFKKISILSNFLKKDNESINNKIFLGTVFQILAIIGAGVFQIYSLRRFLIEKRLY